MRNGAGKATRTAAVVLAAGASTRLGEPKQLARLGRETLLERAVRVCEEAELGPVVVVLGAGAKAVAEGCDLRRAWVVVNAGWAEGMGSSVRAGVELVEGFGEVNGVVVMTCDMPAVTPEHLGRLVAAGAETRVSGSGYGGRRGVPGYFPRAVFGELKSLTGDTGARELLRGGVEVELEGGEWDVDTPEGLAAARERFGS